MFSDDDIAEHFAEVSGQHRDIGLRDLDLWGGFSVRTPPDYDYKRWYMRWWTKRRTLDSQRGRSPIDYSMTPGAIRLREQRARKREAAQKRAA